jgi:hypothetical protein
MPAGGFATISPPRPRSVSASKQRVIVNTAIGAAAVVALCVFGLHQIYNRAGTTKSFVLVSPPPPAVAGLVQNVAAESLPAFEARAAKLKQHYAETLGLNPAGVVIALYQGQAPNVPVIDSLVIYMGFKVPGTNNTARRLKGAIKELGSHLRYPAIGPISGGVGDTNFECVTGDGTDATGVPGQVTTCGWATDRTLGILIREGPDPGANKLSALMLKMWPKLVRH